ncbi:hypothetical protein BpHYR1_009060 [Brachionus plicatilis]|uniref:Uncharacterized protein n=1 Tax=Brachionus plicatilis TaxID=10195 RepID=A0A3M7QMC0_BRAPC|nr:hypothetical protein BpHYR1_009060 [Brachionus plicatilis]
MVLSEYFPYLFHYTVCILLVCAPGHIWFPCKTYKCPFSVDTTTCLFKRKIQNSLNHFVLRPRVGASTKTVKHALKVSASFKSIAKYGSEEFLRVYLALVVKSSASESRLAFTTHSTISSHSKCVIFLSFFFITQHFISLGNLLKFCLVASCFIWMVLLSKLLVNWLKERNFEFCSCENGAFFRV